MMIYRLCCLKSASSSSSLLSIRCANRFARFGRRQAYGKLDGQNSVKPREWGRRSPREVFEQSTGRHVPRRKSELYKPLLFTLAFGTSCFVGASVWQHERYRNSRERTLDSRNWVFKFPEQKYGQLRQELNDIWRKISLGTKTVLYIVLVNAAVCAAWRIPALQPSMKRYFMSSFNGEKLCIPMLLSVFSHISPIHLAVNMYVLWSFAPLLVERITGLEQFCAFYLTSGVVASFAGIMYKAFTGSPKASVGASGAILALLIYTCCKIPTAELMVIFLPSVTFTSNTAIYIVIGLDLAGLLFRWQLFDQAAHLGGSLFGMWYASYGERWWQRPSEAAAQFFQILAVTCALLRLLYYGMHAVHVAHEGKGMRCIPFGLSLTRRWRFIFFLLLTKPLVATSVAVQSKGTCSRQEHLQLLRLHFPVDSDDVCRSPSMQPDDSNLLVPESENETLELTEDEPLQSFDEWARKKLQEQMPVVASTVGNGNGNGATAAPIAARNYASKDCGAKVVLANAEAQNPSALLKDKDNDEYMLNPCETDGPKWFIVELCETVQISCIEMANFELFSSSPREFRLLVSERYPSNEWNLLGEFTAADSRQIQRYTVTSKFYAKYIKVEVLSHYGSEHYCPLSLIRVLGISMVEEYEAEAMKHEAFQSSTGEQLNIMLNDSEEQNGSTRAYLLSTAKYAVKSIAETVLNKASFVFKVVKTTAEQQQRYSHDHTFPSSTSVHVETNGKADPSPFWSCLLSSENRSKRFTSRRCYFTHLLQGGFAPPPESLSHVDNANDGSPSTAQANETVSDGHISKGVDASSHRHCASDGSELLRRLSIKTDQSMFCPVKGNVTRRIFKVRRLIPTVGYPKALNSSNGGSFDSKKTTLNDGGPIASVMPLLPGSSTSGKESIFIRLNNRIKQLEINISLSSQYLSELSRTYKRQMEEMQRNLNRTLSLMAETERRLLSMIEVHNSSLYSLKSRMDEVSSMLTSVGKISVPAQDKWWPWHSGLFFMELCLASSAILFTVLGSDSTSRVSRSEVAKVVMDVLMSELSIRTPPPSYSHNSDDVSSAGRRSPLSPTAPNKSSRVWVNPNVKWKLFASPRLGRALRRTESTSRRAPQMQPQRLRCFSGHKAHIGANWSADGNDSRESARSGCGTCSCSPGVLFSSVAWPTVRNELGRWIEHPGAQSPLKGQCRDLVVSPGVFRHSKANNRPSPSPHG
uniref:SUN domain-containing protein n=1 Tax=Trichuris muris TaxID=70415 RepID=A0A5S6R4S0_TRIMR